MSDLHAIIMSCGRYNRSRFGSEVWAFEHYTTLRSEMQTGEIGTHKSLYSLLLTNVVSLLLCAATSNISKTISASH
jgi:hypothetical protein